ncbi:restriction endonuclease [Streptomyces sp. NPDC048241]|uniref:nSTAND3 domain-containing NTPase n=1 Tax=Streptomyces sp. NPDC048241 TaxID=3365521 RepID=UPI00371F284F
MSRNYAELSPHDFEVLVRDLLQAEFKMRMETFPQGRDGGVDVRLFHDGSERLVIQCKHSPGRSFSQIRSQLESEAKKVKERFAVRYMLVTSAALTRANKEEIVRIFSGVDLKEGDVLGVDDLDNLLTRHPNVETSNFKLWITSSAVLEYLLNSELYRRSSGLVERIIRRRKLYVHSEAYAASLSLIDRHRVCIISGEPGIGKTTLAETLLVKFIAEGWQVHMASEDIADIERVWRPNEKQAFLYDDFLGQNSLLDNLNKNEDSRLAQFIDRVQDVDDKILVMTTREYILQQARQVYERLQRSQLEEGKIVLNLAHYTREQKALIFYNHIYFADLSEVARRSLLHEKNYLEIVHHSNFNPRLIELLTSNFHNSGYEDGDFSKYALKALNDPRDLWERIFESQLSSLERHVLLVLATVRERIELTDLHRALNAYESVVSDRSTSRHQLHLALKKLQGTFVNVIGNVHLDDQANGIHPENLSTFVQLANPSFIDYISSYLSSHPAEIHHMARGCLFYEQVETLAHWEIGESLETVTLSSLMDAFFGRPRNRKQAVRLVPGQQRAVMEGLVRLARSRSCFWGQRFNETTWVRKTVSLQSRHLLILMLDSKHDRTLLSEEVLTGIADEMSRRIAKTAADFLDGELRIMRYLTKYSSVAKQVISARDAAGKKRMESLDRPRDYQSALSIFCDVAVIETEWSQAAENELRAKFYDFASRWDYEQSNNVNSVAECEDAIEELADALMAFDIETELEVGAIGERLEMLQDEVAEELDFGEEIDPDDEDGEHPNRGNGPVSVPNYPTATDDPVEDLFGTLL